MSDGVSITAGSGTTINTDDVGGAHTQRVKVTWGVDGTVTDTSATNPLPVRLAPQTSGGPTMYSLASAATTNSTNVKASAGQIYHIAATNNGTSAAYLKFYNKASAPTIGTDVPVWRLMLPPGGGIVEPLPHGLAFATGIGLGIMTSASDGGGGAVTSNQVYVNLTYS